MLFVLLNFLLAIEKSLQISWRGDHSKNAMDILTLNICFTLQLVLMTKAVCL